MPNSRGVFDGTRVGMKGDGRAVPYFGPPKPTSRRVRGKENQLPALRPSSARAPAPSGGAAPPADGSRVENIMGKPTSTAHAAWAVRGRWILQLWTCRRCAVHDVARGALAARNCPGVSANVSYHGSK